MNIHFEIPNTWCWFCWTFGVALATTLMMSFQSRNFLTRYRSIRKFSILDLEFPSSAQDLVKIIGGMYRLPKIESEKSIRSLRNSLYIDFAFMPAIYGSVFLLCMHVSEKFSWIGVSVFAVFAWFQGLSWIFDIIENIYLLQKIKPDAVQSSALVHELYRYMVIAKWAIALFGGVCSLMALLYFWTTGIFDSHNLKYFLYILAEVVSFLIVGNLLNKKKVISETSSVAN